MSVRAVGFRHAGLRTLRSGPRRAALRELGTRNAMRAALTANRARTRTTLQRMFERWLSGDPLDLTRMSYAELEDLSRLAGWGIAADPGLPPHHLVERARARRSAVAAFEHLVDRNVVGRTAELRRLREHVRGPGRTRGPLLISGPGGAGKTALCSTTTTTPPPAPRWW